MRIPVLFFALVAVVSSIAAIAQQPGGDLLSTAGKLIELPLPTAPELDAADARRMLELQRSQQFKRAEWERKLKESFEAEKEFHAADADVATKLSELQTKYRCAGCDLLWNMTWAAPQGTRFAPEKK
jgi:isopropylmalate/homocitrate/citramalate synthase